MTIAVDWGVKLLFKQTNTVRFNELAHYVINIFVSVISLSYHVIPKEKSHNACIYYTCYTCIIVHTINVHVNHDLY